MHSSTTASTGGQPSALAVDGQGNQYVASGSEVQVIQDGRKSSSISVPTTATSVAVSGQGLIAVGASVRFPSWLSYVLELN